MEEEVLELDESKFSVYKRWLKIDNHGILSLLDRKETQELIEFLQKHLHEVRE